MENARSDKKGRGRQKGCKNKRRTLPEKIHPQQYLSIEDMAELSAKSKSFFLTNLSLARYGKKHTPLPPIKKVGRHNLCRAADFFAWLHGSAI
jgi:hypothetical protein